MLGTQTLEPGGRGRGHGCSSCERESETAETSRTSTGAGLRAHEGAVRTLKNVDGGTHQRGVSGSKKVAGLQAGSANQGKDLSPGGNEVFLYRNRFRRGQHFDEAVACESR